MNAPPQSISRPPAELFGRVPGYGFAGFGVSTAIGNYTDTTTDLAFPGGLLGLLDLIRTYNSLSGTGGALGTGWATWLGVSLTPPPDTGGAVLFNDADGRVLTFTPIPAGGYTRPQGPDRRPDSP